MIPGAEFTDQEATVELNSNLYIYSDGAYEVELHDGEEWRIDPFLEMVAEGPREGVGELDRIENSVREVMKAPEFDDDFSLVVVNFS